MNQEITILQAEAIARIWERLLAQKINPAPISADDQRRICLSILRRLADGWTETECFRMMFRNECFVGPYEFELSIAIRRVIYNEVCARLDLEAAAQLAKGE
jgi:hypothetical protein